jgi:hypothetical protein
MNRQLNESVGFQSTSALAMVSFWLLDPERVRRRLGDVLHGAGQAVLAEQGSLGPAQHLDAIHLEKRSEEAELLLMGDAVDVNADIGQTADAEAGLFQSEETARGRREIDDGVIQTLGCRDVAHLQILRRQVGDRNGHLLDVFRAAARRDDDFFQSARAFRGPLLVCICATHRLVMTRTGRTAAHVMPRRSAMDDSAD